MGTQCLCNQGDPTGILRLIKTIDDRLLLIGNNNLSIINPFLPKSKDLLFL